MRWIQLISLLAVAVSLVVLSGGQAQASGCDAVVTAPVLIQAAVDANPGGKVCLDDSGGIFGQTVVFGPEDSGITLTAEPGDSPVMDGTSLIGTATSVSAITLLGGVEDVTINGLEIRNYEGDGSGNDRSHGITAIDGTTSNITVRNSYLHDNVRNGINAQSDGSFMHDHWTVENNIVSDNGFRGVNLRNTTHSKVEDNYVRNNVREGIFIEARNQLLGVEDVLVKDVKVKGNDVRGVSGRGGIAVHARVESGGGTARVTKIDVEGNSTQTGSRDAIRVQARNDLGGGGATVDDVKVKKNRVSSDSRNGIVVIARGAGATVEKVSVEENVVINNADGDGIFVFARDVGATVDRLRLKKNFVTNSRNGIFVLANFGGTVYHMSVKENQLVDNSHHGINILSENSSIISQSTVSKNWANGNTFMGLWINASTSGELTDNVIEKNVSDSNDIHGIQLSTGPTGIATGNQLKKNTTNNNAIQGIVLQFGGGIGVGIDGNTVENNSATGNISDGFSADTGASINTFKDNRSNLNGGVGYVDGGVTNIYTVNQCNFNVDGPSVPPGLCSP